MNSLPLKGAARYGHIEVVEYFLSKGCDIGIAQAVGTEEVKKYIASKTLSEKLQADLEIVQSSPISFNKKHKL